MALYKIRLNLEPDPGLSGTYTVTSPDVPELITEGSSPEEIWHNVPNAIKSMGEIYGEQGWELPPALRPDNAVSVDEITILQVAA